MIDRSWVFVALVAGMIAVGAACNGCSPHRLKVDAPPVVPVGDASDFCARACAVMARYCDDGRASSCADACRTDQAQGVGAQLRPECVAGAHGLDAVKACGGCE